MATGDQDELKAQAQSLEDGLKADLGAATPTVEIGSVYASFSATIVLRTLTLDGEEAENTDPTIAELEEAVVTLLANRFGCAASVDATRTDR